MDSQDDDIHGNKNSITGDQDEGSGLKMTRLQTVKNVFVIGLGFMFVFSPYLAVSNLQTSLNKEEGIGAWSMATIHTSVMISSVLFPDFVVSKLGCKWTMPVCMSGYILFIAANFHAVKVTMIPSSIMVGLGAACLWPAQGTYMTQMALSYAGMSDKARDDAVSLFFGIFFLFFQSAQIWGNLVSSLIFAPTSQCKNSTLVFSMINTTAKSLENATEMCPILHIGSGTLHSCGAAFCPGDALGEESAVKFEQPKSRVYTVCGIYLLTGVVGALFIALFLDNVALVNKNRRKNGLGCRRLISTFRHLTTSPIQMLLVPLTIYDGMTKAFITGDISKAYVSCSLGIWNVGYVMICYGVVSAIASLIFGRMVKYTGYALLFGIAFIIHGCLLVLLLLWEPHHNQAGLLYALAAVWGMCDAVFTSQLMGLYGRLFSNNTEAAFANNRLWESSGYVILFSCNNYLCTEDKIFLMTSMLLLAIVGFIGGEIVQRKERRVEDEVVEVPGNTDKLMDKFSCDLEFIESAPSPKTKHVDTNSICSNHDKDARLVT